MDFAERSFTFIELLQEVPQRDLAGELAGEADRGGVGGRREAAKALRARAHPQKAAALQEVARGHLATGARYAWRSSPGGSRLSRRARPEKGR
jgi:hypothetical protein